MLLKEIKDYLIWCKQNRLKENDAKNLIAYYGGKK